MLTDAQARAVRLLNRQPGQRMGLVGYVCVLGYIAAAPATAREVAEAFGLGVQAARELLGRMGELGMAHTEGRRKVAAHGPHVPLWAAGAGPVDRVGLPCRQPMPELMHAARILRELAEPRRTAEIAATTGGQRWAVRRVVVAACKLGLAHRCGWEHFAHGGTPAEVFVAGPGQPARRPQPLGSAECHRRLRAARSAKAHSLFVARALAGCANECEVSACA